MQHFTYPNGQNVSVEYRSAANAVQLQEWNAVRSLSDGLCSLQSLNQKNTAALLRHTHLWFHFQEDLYPWVMMIMDELIHPLDGSRVLRVRWQVITCIICYVAPAQLSALICHAFLQPTWSDCNAIVAYDKGHMRDLLLDFDSLSKKQQEERKDAIFKQLDDIESLAKNICG